MAIKPLINETELKRKASQGDERAFTELFYGYYKPMGKFVSKLTQSPELTEEIVQDAFVKIWLTREKLDSIENFGSFLYVLCKNQALTALKKIAAEKLSYIRLEKFIIQETEVESLENPSEAYREMIADAVSRLPVQQQKVYRMSRYERLKYQEIAEKLGLSETTVKKHIQLAVKFIQTDVSSKMGAGILLVLMTPIILG